MGVDYIVDFSLGEDTLRLRSVFDWKWSNDAAGNLSLVPSQRDGEVVLVGISIENASLISILQG